MVFSWLLLVFFFTTNGPYLYILVVDQNYFIRLMDDFWGTNKNYAVS